MNGLFKRGIHPHCSPPSHTISRFDLALQFRQFTLTTSAEGCWHWKRVFSFLNAPLPLDAFVPADHFCAFWAFVNFWGHKVDTTHDLGSCLRRVCGSRVSLKFYFCAMWMILYPDLFNGGSRRWFEGPWNTTMSLSVDRRLLRGKGAWRILTLESIMAPIRPRTAGVAHQEPDKCLNQRRKPTRVLRRTLKHIEW